jgi:hypothetical protein
LTVACCFTAIAASSSSNSSWNAAAAASYTYGESLGEFHDAESTKIFQK